MTKHVTTTHDVPGDTEAVFGTLTSPEWAELKAERLNDGTQLVRREEQPDGGVLFEVTRELPAGVPGFLERFLPRDGRVRQTDVWGPARDGERHGTWTADLPGAPAKVGGTMRLEPGQDGSRYTVESDVKVSIPVVGGKAEGFLSDMIVKLAGTEVALLKDSLSS